MVLSVTSLFEGLQLDLKGKKRKAEILQEQEGLCSACVNPAR